MLEGNIQHYTDTWQYFTMVPIIAVVCLCGIFISPGQLRNFFGVDVIVSSANKLKHADDNITIKYNVVRARVLLILHQFVPFPEAHTTPERRKKNGSKIKSSVQKTAVVI